MPNRFTAVPEGEVPAPRGLQALLLPCADAFMIAMLSRPQSGSLRTTWVTPATFWLSFFSGIIGAMVGVLLAVNSGVALWLRLIGVVVIAAYVLGAFSVGIVGLYQRSRSFKF